MRLGCLWSEKSKRFFLLFICITLLMTILGGCSRSVRKVSYVTDDSAAFQELSPKSDLSSLKSKSPQELVSAGFIYLANRNLKIAELHFITAINKDPKNADAYIGLGQVKILQGNYSEALAGFSKARELQPDSLPALVGEARALRSEGKLDAAIKKINTAMMISPDDIGVLKELAMIYDLMGRENLSAPLYIEIVNKTPDQASSHNNLGLNYMVRGEYQNAILAFLQAHQLDRDNSRIKNNLASAYLLNGDENSALNIFKGTVGEAAAYNNIGYLYMTQGRLDEAEQALNKALQLNPRHYVRAQQNLETIQEMRREERPSKL